MSNAPMNPEQDSEGHVIMLDRMIEVYRWEAARGIFLDAAGHWLAAHDLVPPNDKYLGRIVTPAEVAAREAAAAAEMLVALRAAVEKIDDSEDSEPHTIDLVLSAITRLQPTPGALDRARKEAWREGMEIAAKWHDEQAAAKAGADREGETNTSATIRRLEAGWHRDSAAAIRALPIPEDKP